MARPTFEDVLAAWTADYDSVEQENEEMLAQELNLSTTLLHLLSEGKAVSAVRLAEQSGLSPEQVQALFDHFAAQGGEFDEKGNLVGAALTLNPTPHQLTIDGRRLYAWCSLDTFFIPGLIGKTAEVASTDPVTGDMIRLTVTPEGISEYDPVTTHLSIAVPGLSCRIDGSSGPETGPESEACNQMHFFSSRESAEKWLQERSGIAVLTVEEAWQLARANWLDRRDRLQACCEDGAHCVC